MRINGSAYVVDLTATREVRRDNLPAQGVEQARPAARVIAFDRVELSPQAREMQKLNTEVDALPEIRLDRVALAKQKLQEGGYDSSLLARKLLNAYGVKGE